MTADPKAPRPRLTDVAEIAGVSMKTVSNVINGYVHVTEATRQRVQAAIDEVGYRPNLSARNLARGRAGVIALVVPRLEMPYFASLAGRVIEKAEARGWFVLIHETGGELAAERAALEGHFPQRIDGLIVSAQHLTPDDVRARADGTPLVLLGEQDYRHVADHVAIDNVAASRAAVEHLIAQGCRRIAMVGARPEAPDDPRAEGYRQALTAAGLPIDGTLMRPIHGNLGEEGERATQRLLAEIPQPPDGLFAVTDWVALGAIRALQLAGLRVPEDVAVVGFDDIPYARAVTPSLTTIAPDRSAIAELALRMLEAQSASGETVPMDENVPFELVVRESSARRASPGRPSA
ncbi:LacI family DNA-binding transcriptional regulator [Ruania alkalisoli]|uniref:LacI family DNA-binding transcriptional regulator n=1 Tax=Ruania alkalisoli TaxID=2779775 RepID=A0A7M1SV68_9MICO|nr:LacI family DNA-binding transcriptional regulator [Ruania alkalisoli]QOR70854.1 LacI family DNA-binding transcriptional regulator [Ruania alkalisoli]